VLWNLNSFDDFFEPDAAFVLHAGLKVAGATLLARNQATLRQLGVEFSVPQLLMEMGDISWEVDEFRAKAGAFAPTLLLVEMENGTECGGVAGVPWPRDTDAKGQSKVSGIFSLGATPTRYGLVSPDKPAVCVWWSGLGFGSVAGNSDLGLFSDGWGCSARGQMCYAGPLGVGSLPGTSPSDCGPYTR
jgi:hypothetical protein